MLKLTAEDLSNWICDNEGWTWPRISNKFSHHSVLFVFAGITQWAFPDLQSGLYWCPESIEEENKMTEPLVRINNLTDQIRYHRKLYYGSGKTEISDREHDKLEQELRELEEVWPCWDFPDSPSHTVGSENG